jgi:uncharacterized protein YqjF (DUF2071 family)
MREADIAKQRLLSVPGDPLVHVEWHRVLFLNYVIDPKIVRPHIPPAFELDLHDGQACISLVRVIMRNYRRAPNAPRWGAIFGALREQRFLNFRTYVRHHDEPGAFFMWGWLSRPLGLPLPNAPAGLTCAFANLSENRITSKDRAFAFDFDPNEINAAPCQPGSINEFALERYSGFFAHRGTNFVFRAWHEPWLVAPAKAKATDVSLITSRFPWFANATFVDSAYAPLSDPVWLGRAHRLAENHHRTRAFLELP